MTADLRIGTSGWDYKHWRETLYPPGERPNLCRYAEQFDTVEINNSFYRLPSPQTFEKWHDGTPADFLFAVKASRFITHMKKLKDPTGSFEKFFTAVAHLGPKLGPILFQFPPRWACNLQRLSEFLDVIRPKRLRSAFEFRNETWFADDVYDALKAAGAALCLSEREDNAPPPLVETASWGYVRLRLESYADDDLRKWARTLAASSWNRTHVYFMHEPTAPAYAKSMMEFCH